MGARVVTQVLAELFHPGPIAMVVAGSGAIAMAQQGLGGTIGALRALHPMLSARPDADRDAARAALHRVDAVVELYGLARTDRVKTAHPFVEDALVTLANARDVEHFARWAEDALSDRAERHNRAILWWTTLADTAPAMGMAGTILGLVAMFQAMSDPSAVGAGMALALLTTLYGVVIANAVAGPIASRLAQLSAREISWQRALVERMSGIARREIEPPVPVSVPAPTPLRRPSPREAA